MKEIILNPDDTLNILDDSKIYILRLRFISSPVFYYYLCEKVSNDRYAFVLLQINTDVTYHDTAFRMNTLQECIYKALYVKESIYCDWIGNIFQFDSIKESEQYFNIIMR